MLIDEDIERLEGPRWRTLASQSAETKMWKRSYLMALYALDVVRKRAPASLNPDHIFLRSAGQRVAWLSAPRSIGATSRRSEGPSLAADDVRHGIHRRFSRRP